MALPNPLVTSSKDRLGGTPVFSGTRVPVQTLFDYLEAGDPLSEFLRQFPGVTREHAVALIQLARGKVLAESAADVSHAA